MGLPGGGLGFKFSQFWRLYEIDKQIRSGKFPNTRQLAELLEVKPRTVERDIEHLRDRLGAPIVYDRQKKGYRYLTTDFHLPRFTLTEGEMITLFLAQKVLRLYRGTPFEQDLKSAFEKITAMLPSSVSVDFSLVDQVLSFDVQPVRGQEDLVAGIYRLLMQALEERRTVWVRYYTVSRDQVSERYLDPYHVRYHQGAWYLIAYCHTRAEVRIFALDRIRELKVMEERFEPVNDFSLEEYLGLSMGIERGYGVWEVAIKFTPFQARWIRERKWHASQEMEELDDGSLILKLKVAGLNEVKRWVLSFGKEAEVLAPPELREEIAAELAAMVALY